MDMLKIIAPPIHSEGWKFIGIFAAVTLVLFLFIEPLGWIGAGATLWCYYFFRDPERATPLREGLVISPADGKVCSVAPVAPPSTLGLGDEPRVRISIFMNVFNCHVNRLPIAGRITKIVYTPGKFLNASLDKASEDNERNALAVEIDGGYGDLGVVQIAGLVARRILCEVEEDRHLETGERFGMIRFGSRLDVYLPVGSASLVAVGQTAVAGETVIADLTSKEAQRGARIS